jgi:hypothetical protein
MGEGRVFAEHDLFPAGEEEDMNAGSKILPALMLLFLVFCGIAAATVSANVLPWGGYVSTSTSVLVDGSVNDTVYIKYSTIQNGFTEKNEWESSYMNQTPARQSFSSRLSLGTLNGGLWWNFQKTGSPVVWMSF